MEQQMEQNAQVCTEIHQSVGKMFKVSRLAYSKQGFHVPVGKDWKISILINDPRTVELGLWRGQDKIEDSGWEERVYFEGATSAADDETVSSLISEIARLKSKILEQ